MRHLGFVDRVVEAAHEGQIIGSVPMMRAGIARVQCDSIAVERILEPTQSQS